MKKTKTSTTVEKPKTSEKPLSKKSSVVQVVRKNSGNLEKKKSKKSLARHDSPPEPKEEEEPARQLPTGTGWLTYDTDFVQIKGNEIRSNIPPSSSSSSSSRRKSQRKKSKDSDPDPDSSPPHPTPKTPPKTTPTSTSAIWLDKNPGTEGRLKNGQHYWSIQFGDLTCPVDVGLSSLDRLGKDGTTKGFLYYSTFKKGKIFGPSIRSKDKFGLLATFTGPTLESRIQIYTFYNGKCLGLTFDLLASIFPDGFHPIVSFGEGKGVCRIVKVAENQVPKSMKRDAVVFTGVCGSWKMNPAASTVKCTRSPSEEDMIKSEAGTNSNPNPNGGPPLPPPVYVFIIPGTPNGFAVQLQVGGKSSVAFLNKSGENWREWKSGSGELKISQREIKDDGGWKTLKFVPESITFSGNIMTVQKGKNTAQFLRFDDPPPPIRQDYLSTLS